MVVTVFWLGISYLLGSIPFGLLIARAFCQTDPLSQGSKNIGATNIARTCGLGYGILTLLLDVFKGWLPVIIATSFTDSGTFLSLTALAAVMGHMYSVFQHGKGGKGMATTVGVFLALAPGCLCWAILCFFIALFASGYVSMGSLVLTSTMPLFLLLGGHFSLIILAFVLMALIFWQHRDNIERLRVGEEHSWKKARQEAPSGS
ncbi:MAG: acyl-phosphate glycerol 3-phosphate acyltransferase [Deltaproteobacteria bacterium]|nr:MAG: acyl-phosphate glycerol 3-phosphate acyltransferase [Deltaproteobacteria bacterium]